ncbi:MAG: TRAP transporter large permease subunit [SAR324 cluster bacterium]|nr:TRAP transporter large permease subunit [SAR324 cluster bacterium]
MFEAFPLLMFVLAIGILLLGYPVAFSLAGSALAFGGFAFSIGLFDISFFSALPARIYGIMGNQTLIAVPLFIFMGVMLERSKISEELLTTLGLLFGQIKGGIGVSIFLVGALLAASTGIVGATVVTMGLISLPVMLRYNYKPSFSAGIICASGTLGQIIPPSIILVLLGDVISSAYQQAQLNLGNFAPGSVSVGDLFLGALFPGFVLVGCYIIYILVASYFNPNLAPAIPAAEVEKAYSDGMFLRVLQVLIPPLLLIMGVLGSILAGMATPTEAASVGCIGAIILTKIKGQLKKEILKSVLDKVVQINAMVFIILIGSSMFSLVFRGLGGDEVIARYLQNLPGGVVAAFLLVMLVIFILGFFLDFFEITFVVVPIVGPILLMMGLDPIWLGIMIAMNLQTSFLTPPFGFALFYLRGVAPDHISTKEIYQGVIPFIAIQILVMGLLALFPEIVTWLPHYIYGS